MRLRHPNLRLFALSVLCIASAVGRTSGSEPTPDDVDVERRLVAEEAKLDLLNEKLLSLDHELAKLDDKQTTLLGELHKLDIQIRVASEQLDLLKLQLKRAYRDIDENLKRIQALEDEVESLKPYLSSRSVSLYKLGRLSYLRLLLSVEEPSELTRAFRYISRLAREDGAKMRQFFEDEIALRETKAELLLQTERMLATRNQLETTTANLKSRRDSRETLLEEVAERQEMAGTLAFELEGSREKLGELVQSLVLGEVVDADTVHLTMRVFAGEVVWPVEGELDGRFGTQLHPRFKTVTVRNGIEIDASAGTSINSVYEGDVVFASWFEGYGKLLIVRHPGGVHSLYGYLADFRVEEGDWVEKGTAVGWVGDTGSFTGPKLYFELRVDGKPVDPEDWLDPTRSLARGN